MSFGFVETVFVMGVLGAFAVGFFAGNSRKKK